MKYDIVTPLSTDMIRILAWIQWSGCICVNKSGTSHIRISGRAIDPAIQIFKDVFNIQLKVKSYKYDNTFRFVSANGRSFYDFFTKHKWGYKKGKIRVPQKLLRDREFVKHYLSAVIDAVGFLSFDKNDVTKFSKLVIKSDIRDVVTLVKIMKQYDMPVPTVTLDNKRRQGHQIKDRGSIRICGNSLTRILDFINWDLRYKYNSSFLGHLRKKYSNDYLSILKRSFA